jgi:hypothetical protein
MRKRRRWLALLAVTLFGAVSWLMWPTSPAVITAAKEKYERLQLGMSVEDVETILGRSRDHKSKVYRTWKDNLQWYANDSQVSFPPRHDHPFYEDYQWSFGDYSGGGTAVHRFYINALVRQGRVVALWHSEYRWNKATRLLREVGRRVSLDLPFLREQTAGGHKAIPPQ